jgi:hypothetical protein
MCSALVPFFIMRVDGSQGFFFGISLTAHILYAKYVHTKHQGI